MSLPYTSISMRSFISLSVLMALTSILSCKKEAVFDCDSAQKSISTFLEKDIRENMPKEAAEDALKSASLLARSIKDECKKQQWPTPIIRCIALAESITALSGCDPKVKKQLTEP